MTDPTSAPSDVTPVTRDSDGVPDELSLPASVLDELLEGCQLIGFDYTYLYLNDLAAAQGRTPKDQLLGRTMMACFPGIDQTAMFALLRRCLTQRTRERIENEFEFPDGTRIVFELKLIPVPQGACILSLDITERRHRLAAIVQDSDDAIVSRGLDGLISSWNRGAERMFGYTAGEMIGQPFHRLIPRELQVPAQTAAERFANGEHMPSFETVRLHKDGRRIQVSLAQSPYRDAAGKVIGVSMIARDITELKQIQHALVSAMNNVEVANRGLQVAKDAADAANRELEAFAYSVAHDLRAPVRHIDGFALAVIEDHADQLDGAAQKYLQRIRQSTALMARLIEDLLKLSQASRQELARTIVDISALARTIVARMQLGDPDRHVDVVIESGLTTRGDRQLLAVVLDNLIGNAWKFTGKRPDAKIEIGASDDGGIFVRDNGVGFDMAYAKNLFVPFQRLHASHEFEGTGIGLATVHRIVQRHGGRVWARSEVGAGATFTFTVGELPGSRTSHTP